MLTIDALQALGVDTQEGLGRCMNNEAFYFRLIAKAMEDNSIEKLKEAIEAGNLDTAFELSHALKGVLGNLALTPLYTIVCEMTEHLRAKEQADYSVYLAALLEKKDELVDLCREKVQNT